MAGIPWTEKERNILRELVSKGYGAREIRNVLRSRSLDAIRCQTETLGISLGRKEPEINETEYARLMEEVKII